MEEQKDDFPFLRGETANTLDFYRIREKIAELAATEEGREALLQREPTANVERIEYLKNLGREWNNYINSPLHPQFYAWPKVKDVFVMLGIEGAAILQDQAFALGIFCKAQEKLKQSINSAYELDIPHLKERVSSMPNLQEACNIIFSVLTPDGDIKDSPDIRKIRNNIAALHKEIDFALRRYTTDTSLSSALQSTVPVLRNNKELLAVKADHRSSIKGIIHEVSSSGQTLYIEVEESVKASNELIQAEFELQAQIRKVLKELTAKLGIYKQDFYTTHDIMLELDTAYASARWQSEVHGIFTDTCDIQKEPPILYAARHPLLKEKAIPVDIRFLDGHKIMIITGPNTGGKTVTLKTIALFCLLHQAGFPIPAEEGSRLPIFKEIFADIGDDQSIDESLSTFSSHIKKIAQIIKYASPESLILLDELGSGTDPQEGGAIAMAVLDSLIEKESFVIVTTHHGILKNYAFTNEDCTNASVEFDSDTMRPTYKILTGVPGESHAIDIAKAAGLNEQIIQNAQHYLATDRADVSTLIKGLTQKHSQLDSLLAETKQREQKIEQKELKLQTKELELKEKEQELKEKDLRQNNEFLRQTRSKLENLVRHLREGEINRQKTLEVRSFIDSITQEVDKQEILLKNAQKELEKQKEEVKHNAEKLAANGMRLSFEQSKSFSNKKKKKHLSNAQALQTASVMDFPPQKTQPTKEKVQNKVKAYKLEEGKDVYVGKERRVGTLLQQNKDQSWLVQIGAIKMTVPKSYLQLVPEQQSQNTSYVVETAGAEKEVEKPLFELRLLGMRQEEATKALEHQLDLCAIHNFKNFSIIHGKGTGILQQTVIDILSHYPGVKDFTFASPEDGGAGKTYVSLL